jgi:hypothetical protein
MLDLWIERRSGLYAKGFWPELRYVIALTPTTWKQRYFAEGVCMERSTSPPHHDRIDELGFAVSELPNLDRDILILSRMGDMTTCLQILRDIMSIHPMIASLNGTRTSVQHEKNSSPKPARTSQKGIKPHEVARIDRTWWLYATMARRRGLV